MKKNNHLDDHSSTRKKLRVIGIVCLVIGFVLLLIGIISMMNFNQKGFLSAVIGMPFLVVGAACTMLGFMGAVSRYTASESAPILKNTKNYMEEETRAERVKTFSEMVEQMHNDEKVNCPHCGAVSSDDAKFCKNCGNLLVKTCSCGVKNSPDASFCKACGKKL